jgi:hypothetical protein
MGFVFVSAMFVTVISYRNEDHTLNDHIERDADWADGHEQHDSLNGTTRNNSCLPANPELTSSKELTAKLTFSTRKEGRGSGNRLANDAATLAEDATDEWRATFFENSATCGTFWNHLRGAAGDAARGKSDKEKCNDCLLKGQKWNNLIKQCKNTGLDICDDVDDTKPHLAQAPRSERDDDRWEWEWYSPTKIGAVAVKSDSELTVTLHGTEADIANYPDKWDRIAIPIGPDGHYNPYWVSEARDDDDLEGWTYYELTFES